MSIETEINKFLAILDYPPCQFQAVAIVLGADEYEDLREALSRVEKKPNEKPTGQVTWYYGNKHFPVVVSERPGIRLEIARAG